MQPLGPFRGGRRMVVAVSGGGDSMALVVLLSRWGAPVAAIVDHGLRPESSDEAALTANRLQALGIESIILRADLRPGPAVAERARAARYGLLLRACREVGCPDLLLAHHAADQAETIRMRQDAGSGSSGLAGMAPIAYRDEARLLRPLLAVPPTRLRATLLRAGVPWVEDPSNRDRHNLRARIRADMDEDGHAAALATACRSGAGRRLQEIEVASELARARFHPEGFAVVPASVSAEALSAVIWAVSGRAYPPSRAALKAGLVPRTTHGAILRPAGRLGAGTLVSREPGAVAGPEPARAGLLWDGRFRVAGTLAPGITVGALGVDSARLRRLAELPSVVMRSLPALRRGENLIAVPHLGFPDAETCRSVLIWFSPARPAAGAPFFAVRLNPLVGRGV